MTESVLYLIVRTDMASMTPGRVAAQCAHAHGVMEELLVPENVLETEMNELEKAWYNWKDARGFGTTIVLSDITVFGNRLSLTELDKKIIDTPARFVYDPTYPIKDGAFTHHVGIHTVLAVFVVDKNKKPDILNTLELYTGTEKNLNV